MADTLTESFCERCGTRYEFRAPTRLNPLRKTRGIFGGLKTYLTGQDSLSEAMDDAMRTEQGALASAQLEAFHESFNFCIDCRQYTCVNCWNDDAGRCRTCVPAAGVDDVGDVLAATLAGGVAAEPLSSEPHVHAPPGLEAWPTADLPPALETTEPAEPAAPWPSAEPIAATSAVASSAAPAEGVPAGDGFVYDTPRVSVEELAAMADPRAEIPWPPVAAEIQPEAEPVAAEVEPEPVVAEVEPEPEPEPVVAESSRARAGRRGGRARARAGHRGRAEPEPVIAEVTHPPLRVLTWDDDAAYEVEPEPVAAEPEAEPVAAVEPEPEPVAAVEPEPEPVAAVEPEPVAAVEPEPEPRAAVEPEPEPVAAVEPEPEPVAAVEWSPAEPVAAAEAAPGAEPVIRHTIAPVGDTILRFPQRRPAASPPPVERVAAQDDAPEVAARRAQLEGLGLGDPGEGPVLPEPPAIAPYRSRGAAIPQGELAARAVAQGVSFWEASAREVAEAAAAVGIQNCAGCGLSLSASARFCRRCGTPQSRSA